MNKNKKLGFTLAEVLIVIGIIGVVAALTLPNLNHATGDKETITKVKKIHSSLTEAFDRAQAIYGDYDTWFKDLSTNAEISERAGKRVTEFMKISKDCGLETNKGCFTTGLWSYLSSSSPNPPSALNLDADSNYYKVITADGMSIAFVSRGVGTNIISVYVDIDGPNKGAFTAGKDIFQFQLDSSSILQPYKFSVSWAGYIYAGENAAAWILENDNADYLKADSSGKCNDSDVILDWTTNTSCH